MVKYYIAIGKLEVHNKIPTVISCGKENQLTVAEFILWAILSHNILNIESLESEFNRKLHINRINADVSFEQTLNRLILRGLVAAGEDYLAVNALYNLVKSLYILPLGKVSTIKRYTAFMYFLLFKGVSFNKCRQYLKKQQYSELDNKIIAFSKRNEVTIAELIKICENNLWNIKNEDEIIDKLYVDGVDSQNIENLSVFSKCQNNILTAVVNLYLNGQLIFDKA